MAANDPARAPDPVQARDAAAHVARTLQNAGHTAYFAGGCVRDELLGLHPTDYDIATDATPDRVRELFRSTAHVGVSFGVVIVRLSRTDNIGLDAPAHVEVATFRADGDYSDRRRPDSVRFAGEVEDANRRDFTVNALFLDPVAPADGESIRGHVIDHVGGVGDLHDRMIRAVGVPDDRLAEDHLRALRGVRFASRLGFAIDPATAEAIRRHAAELQGVSTERIGDEIRRMLAHHSRAAAVELMRSLGLEAAAVGKPTLTGLERLAALPADATIPTALAAWGLDRGDRGATFRTRLCLSNHDQDRFEATIATTERLRHDWPALGVAGRKRLAARDEFGSALLVLRGEDPDRAITIEAEANALAATPGGLSPHPLIAGSDLIRAGFSPGPLFSPALDRAYDAQLEGRATTREACLAVARSVLESGLSGNR